MAKSFWERYEHYDPKDGFGSAQEWADLADLLAAKVSGGFTTNTAKGSRKVEKGKKDPDLETLMLDKMPESVDKLKTAYRNSLFLYHPDHGGTNEQAIAAREAFERLLVVVVRRSKDGQK